MFNRIFLIAFRDFRKYLRRPMTWVWISLIGLLYFGLSQGGVSVQVSGDAVSGGAKAHLTSEFYNARMTTVFTALMHGFFTAVLFGMPVLQDLDTGIMPVFRSTRLKTWEYLTAKFLGCLMTLLMVLGCSMLVSIFFNHVVPHPGRDEFFGEFSLSNYLMPYLKLALPHLLLIGGISFAIGAVLRKPILVFFFPIVVLVAFLFLMEWSPVWLPNWANQLLQRLEPSGFRWLNTTYFSVDRGVEFYNNEPITLEFSFLLSRIAMVGIGLGAFLTTLPLFSRFIRVAKNGPVAAVNDPVTTLKRPAIQDAAGPGLASLQMGQGRTSLISDVWTIMKYELKELRYSPALYLFVPFILLEVIGTSFLNEGPFGTPALHTPGTLATSAMGTLSLLGCLLLMFYTVESQLRERIKKLAPIFYSSQARSFAMLMGKTLANAAVAFVIIAASLVGCLIILMIQGVVGLDFVPFALVWGLLLLPTYIVWSAFITMVIILTRSRYTTYAIGAIVFFATLYLEVTGDLTWFSNWQMNGVLQWSDISVLEMDREVLWLNRLFMLSLALLFIYIASRFFWRRGLDPVQIATRVKPGRVFGFVLRALPFAVVPAVLGGMIWGRVDFGHQGESVEDMQRDYWKQNVSTWSDVDTVAVTGANISLDIEPEEQALMVNGIIRLANNHDDPMEKFVMTVGAHWKDVKWQMDESYVAGDSELSKSETNLKELQRIIEGGESTSESSEASAAGESSGVAPVPTDEGLVEFETDDRSGLHVFELATPLMPGDSLKIGYEFQGKYLDGASKNGGGSMEFILPSGVVLTSFSPSFWPQPGFAENVGLDDDMSPNSEKKEFDFFEEELPSMLGSGGNFHVRTTITGPEDFTFNGVGVKHSDEVNGGRRTVVWESDEPVSFFNVVGGRWKVHEGEATEIYYSELHPYNVEEMSEALEAARIWYSKWFTPYPWKELRISEFPSMATYAQGFPTNITFSEGIGFLTKEKAGSNAPFMVTAHEAAHQWWGNILTPGQGPGGNILSEGTAHFSTGLLLDQVKGERARIEFFTEIENSYATTRSVDAERPMIEVDGSKNGDTTVTYDRGGWVFWMLLNHMGRRDCLQGMQAFIAKYRDNPDHPVIQDFLILMREFAKDKPAYDEFVRQWFLDTVVPEYKFEDVEMVQDGDEWVITGTVRNKGTGKMPLTIAASINERFVENEVNEDYQDARTEVVLAADEEAKFEIRCSFKPEKVFVDPDAKVLQLNRKLASFEF